MAVVQTPAGEVDRLTLAAIIRLRAAFTISSVDDWIYRPEWAAHGWQAHRIHDPRCSEKLA